MLQSKYVTLLPAERLLKVLITCIFFSIYLLTVSCVHDSSCSVEDEIDVGQLDDQNVESRPVDKKLIKLLSILLKKKQSKNVDQEAN